MNSDDDDGAAAAAAASGAAARAGAAGCRRTAGAATPTATPAGLPAAPLLLLVVVVAGGDGRVDEPAAATGAGTDEPSSARKRLASSCLAGPRAPLPAGVGAGLDDEAGTDGCRSQVGWVLPKSKPSSSKLANDARGGAATLDGAMVRCSTLLAATTRLLPVGVFAAAGDAAPGVLTSFSPCGMGTPPDADADAGAASEDALPSHLRLAPETADDGSGGAGTVATVTTAVRGGGTAARGAHSWLPKSKLSSTASAVTGAGGCTGTAGRSGCGADLAMPVAATGVTDGMGVATAAAAAR